MKKYKGHVKCVVCLINKSQNKFDSGDIIMNPPSRTSGLVCKKCKRGTE